jgi:hypothetical protein
MIVAAGERRGCVGKRWLRELASVLHGIPGSNKGAADHPQTTSWSGFLTHWNSMPALAR